MNKKELTKIDPVTGKGPDAEAATNAFGMVDVDFGNTSTGWYETNKATVGRFVAKDGDSRTATGKSVAYVLEKMKSPSDLILLGDSFSLDNNDQDAAFWTFNPNGGKPKFNNAQDEGANDTRITTIHRGNTTVAYADGRAESIAGASLKATSLKVSKIYDDNFKGKDL